MAEPSARSKIKNVLMESSNPFLSLTEIVNLIGEAKTYTNKILKDMELKNVIKADNVSNGSTMKFALVSRLNIEPEAPIVESEFAIAGRSVSASGTSHRPALNGYADKMRAHAALCVNGRR